MPALAGLILLVVGLWMLLDGALGWCSTAIAVTVAVALTAAVVALRQTPRRRRREADLTGRSPAIN